MKKIWLNSYRPLCKMRDNCFEVHETNSTGSAEILRKSQEIIKMLTLLQFTKRTQLLYHDAGEACDLIVTEAKTQDLCEARSVL